MKHTNKHMYTKKVRLQRTFQEENYNLKGREPTTQWARHEWGPVGSPSASCCSELSELDKEGGDSGTATQDTQEPVSDQDQHTELELKGK